MLALLQANANALSASVKMNPPWHVAWPFSMSARTFIVNSARPGPTLAMRMPLACDARSRANISAATRSASDCASAEVRDAAATTDVSGLVIAIEHREVLAAT